MRTTLTIDADVAVRLERLRRSGRPLEEIVNEALRAGLDALERPSRRARTSCATPVDLGDVLMPSDDISEVLDVLDAEEWKQKLGWEGLLAFVRIATNPRVLTRTAAVSRAWGQVEAWLESPVAWIPLPTDRRREILGKLLSLGGSGTTDVHDARLATIALEHGLTLCSADRDFARFPALRFESPLAA